MGVARRLVAAGLRKAGWTLFKDGEASLGPTTNARLIDRLDFAKQVFDFQTEAADLLRLAAPYSMTSVERMMVLYQLCRYVESTQLPGDFVECGVWRGGSAGIMAGANVRHGSATRTLWLYDSFAGLPEPSVDDGERARRWARGRAGGRLVSVEKNVVDEGPVLELLTRVGFPVDSVRVVKGWFQDTLPHTKPSQIAVLRLDGDWYESTKVCLEHLYDRVVDGGMVIIDDYGDWEGCKKAVDEFFDARGAMPLLHHVDRTCRYVVKGC